MKFDFKAKYCINVIVINHDPKEAEKILKTNEICSFQ